MADMTEQEASKLAMLVLDSTADNPAQSLVQVLYKDSMQFAVVLRTHHLPSDRRDCKA